MYHLFNFLNLVMLVALALAFVVLSWIDAGVIMAIILTNAAIGFSQEYKSEKTLQALRDFSSPTSVVLRDGHHQEVDAESYVICCFSWAYLMSFYFCIIFFLQVGTR